MDLNFALLADFVGETREGKLVIAGVFDNIQARTFPTTHLQAYLVARWDARVSEGSRHRLNVRLEDHSGRVMVDQLAGDSQITFVPQGPGKRLRGQAIVQIGLLRFESAGSYRFRFLLDGKPNGEAPFDVIKLELE